MILTVTLNTALDLTYRVPALRPRAEHRVTEVTERPGGKGVNVARVLAALGHEVTVTGFVGGATGRSLHEQLSTEARITDALVPVSGTTRRTVAVVDTSTGDTTQFNEPGPVIAPMEWSGFLETYEELVGAASAVALCGSLPPGVSWAEPASPDPRTWRRPPCPPRRRNAPGPRRHSRSVLPSCAGQATRRANYCWR